MRVRALSPTGDYTFGRSQGNFLANSAAAVGQLIQTALALMQGEWFLDLTKGTPYGTRILGFGTTGLYDVAIQNVILGVPGVSQLSDYASQLDTQTRQLSVQALVQTSFGPVPVSAVVGLPRQPPVPLGFAALACDGEVLLTWEAVPGTTYQLYRGTVAGALGALPVAVGLTDGFATQPAVNGQLYYYSLVAVVAGVISEPTPELSVAAGALGTSVLTPVAGVGSIALTWTAAAGASGYAVLLGTAPDGEGPVPVATTVGLSTTLTGLTAAQTYYLKLVASNPCGQTTTSAEVSATPS